MDGWARAGLLSRLQGMRGTATADCRRVLGVDSFKIRTWDPSARTLMGGDDEKGEWLWWQVALSRCYFCS